MSKTNWIVTTSKLDLHCKRCGESYQPNLPIPVDMWVAMSRIFIGRHKHCTANASVTENLMTGGEE